MTIGLFDPTRGPPDYKPRVRESALQKYQDYRFCCAQADSPVMGFGSSVKDAYEDWCYRVHMEIKRLRELQDALKTLK